ncbi:hypothetical protein FOL46_006530 [Perkinsus olseni]|uniref:CRAL-TRIO domain-containing protein n=1 Tax=Perkinsus olseni TaxID=32597 RepID=A0A7J6LK29_PEROL|nr:hypothetical protein FOL46_006530 [Perkinsus olseni]
MSIDVTCPIGDYILPPEVLVWKPAGRDMFTRFKNEDQERRIFLNVELMPHELEAIDEVYATLERREITLARQLEPRILRYLYHARFNVDRAVKELVETQKWRLEYFKQPMCDEDLLHELNTVSTESGPMANGDPMCLLYMGELFTSPLYMLLPSKVESIVMIVDFDGVGFDAPFSTAFALYKVLAHHYMGRMAAMYLVNSPSFMTTVVRKLARKVMTERQLQKNHIVADVGEDLARYFDADQLERRYGGAKANIKRYYPITHLSSNPRSVMAARGSTGAFEVCPGGNGVIRSSKLATAYGVMRVSREDLPYADLPPCEAPIVPEGTTEDVQLDELDHLLLSKRFSVATVFSDARGGYQGDLKQPPRQVTPLSVETSLPRSGPNFVKPPRCRGDSDELSLMGHARAGVIVFNTTYWYLGDGTTLELFFLSELFRTISALSKLSNLRFYSSVSMPVVVEFARPILFTVFGQPVYGYGLCMALAFMSALLLGDGELRRKALKIDSSALLLSAMIGGILGSRLHYMLTWNSSSSVSFWDMSTGHSFQGGLLGGIVGTTGYAKLYCKESIGRMLDALAPLLLIGHAIGKIGCFISGDGCYGYPTDVPWAMSFPNGLVPTTIAVHPAPLYEMITSAGVGLILWARRKQREAVTWAQVSDFFVLLGSTRFFVERYRGHNRLEGVGISQYQVVALCFILAGLVIRLAISRGWISSVTEKKSEKNVRAK